jgi:hypothetical protein
MEIGVGARNRVILAVVISEDKDYAQDLMLRIQEKVKIKIRKGENGRTLETLEWKEVVLPGNEIFDRFYRKYLKQE